MVDEKGTRETKAEEAPKTEIKVFVNGEEAASVEVENVRGVSVSGYSGGTSFPVSPESQVPVHVFVLTVENPEPIRPPTQEEAEAKKKAEEDFQRYQKEQDEEAKRAETPRASVHEDHEKVAAKR